VHICYIKIVKVPKTVKRGVQWPIFSLSKAEFGGQTLKEQSKKGLDDLRFLIAVIALLAAVIAVGGRILYRHLRRRKNSAGND